MRNWSRKTNIAHQTYQTLGAKKTQIVVQVILKGDHLGVICARALVPENPLSKERMREGKKDVATIPCTFSFLTFDLLQVLSAKMMGAPGRVSPKVRYRLLEVFLIRNTSLEKGSDLG